MKKFLSLSLTALLASTALFSCGGGDEDEPQEPDVPVVGPSQPDEPDEPDQPDNPGGGDSDSDHNPNLPELAAQFENLYSPVLSTEGFMADSDVTRNLIGYWNTDGKYDQNLVLLPNGRFRLSDGGSWMHKWVGWGDWAYNAAKSTISLFDANVSIEISAFNSAGDKFSGTMFYQSSTGVQFSAIKVTNTEYGIPDGMLQLYCDGINWDNVNLEGNHISNDQPLMPWSLVGMYNSDRYALTKNCSYLIDDDIIMIVYWQNQEKGLANAIWWIEKPWSASPRMVAYTKSTKFKYFVGRFKSN